MDVGLFDFDLPEDRIALRPASPRDAARLLVVRPDSAQPFADLGIRDLPSLLQPGDALVLNDTRVIPSRLRGRRYRGEDSARVERSRQPRSAPRPCQANGHNVNTSDSRCAQPATNVAAT